MKLNRQPQKREILISIAVFSIVLVLLVVAFSPSFAGSVNSGAGSALPSAQAPTPLFGIAGDLYTSQSNSPHRVISASEALVGEVNHGSFENVSSQMISSLDSVSGYIASSNLMYNGTTWNGVWAVNVPTSNATFFLFQMKALVDANGKTTSININTQDVTNSTGGNQSKVPFAPFTITLQEMALNSGQAQPALDGLFGSIGAILVVIFDGTLYVALIAIPLYLLVLGSVLVSGRFLYPTFLKVMSKSSTQAKQRDTTSDSSSVG